MKIILSKNPKIQGLITKDLLQLKTYKRTLISFILIFTATTIIQLLSGGENDLLGILPVMITLGFGMFSIASFNYDETSKTDRYIRSLPISKKEIVLSKYYLAIGSTIIGALIGISLTIILSMLFIKDVSFIAISKIILVSLGGILGLSIVEAIQIPCIYKFGAEKARMQIFIIMVILMVVFALLIGGIFYWLERWAINMNNLKPIIPFVLAGLIVFVYHSSYKIAYKIYEKKEF